MITLFITISICIAAGFLAGPSAVYIFNRIPALWLCEYGETPEQTPRFREELEDPHYRRVKENPWRWVFSAGFICICLKLALVRYRDGLVDVSLEANMVSWQLAAAAFAACWILLIIALADMKYMIIPDQFVLLLAVTAVGFWPSFREGTSAGPDFLPSGVAVPLAGFLAGAVVMGLVALAGRIICRGRAVGMGDVKLCAVAGLVTGFNGIIMIMAAAAVLNGVIAGAGLLSGKYKVEDAKPFGPCLCGCAAAYIVLFTGV